MGAHRAARKTSTKTWLVPAVGTAFAVSGQSLIAGGAAEATDLASSSSTLIAPQLQSDAKTFEAVAKSLSAKRMATPRLTTGMKRSGYVLYVQKKLGVMPKSAKLGKVRGAGFFGPRTKAAVKRFQRAKGISQIGSVGPKTWKAILKIGAGKTWKGATASKARKSVRASRNSKRAPLVRYSGSRSERVIRYAKTQLHRKYVWGGTGGAGFDCSGYTGWVFKQVGINLPRTSRQQFGAVDRISKSQARPGDLFFVRNSSGRIYHVGIVGKNGKWLEARNSRSDVGEFEPWASGSKVMYGRV